MLPIQIIALCIRLFAIALFVYVLRNIADFVFYLDSADDRLPVLVSAITIVLALFVSVASWFFPITFAGWLLRGSDVAGTLDRWSKDDTFTTAFVFVGLLWLFSAFSDALYWLFFMMIATGEIGWSDYTPDSKAAVIATVFELILAMSLILGAQGWKSVIYRLRYGRDSITKGGNDD